MILRHEAGKRPELHYFMHDHFFDHVNIDPSRINLPNGMEPDEKKELLPAMMRCFCSVGDVDIQLLGIGRNGHIGFNEPDNCFAKGTHCVELTESTSRQTSAFSPARMRCRAVPTRWAFTPS